MSLYGYNRATLNGGVSGIIAGAALVLASSGFAAEATRWVMPTSTLSGSGAATATGLRSVFGGGAFLVTLNSSALPGLLQLVTSDITVGSSLHVTYTDAHLAAYAQLQGDGTIIRPGTGISSAVWSTSLDPLIIAGFTSSIVSTSSCSADASVQLNGQTTWQRDGYASAPSYSVLTADGLKTALGYANVSTVSDCITDSIKIHGGSADFSAVWLTSVVASTDAARIAATSELTGTSVVTRYCNALLDSSSSLYADPVLTTFAEPVNLLGEVTLVSTARLAEQGVGAITTNSTATASGTIYKLGTADLTGLFVSSAQWALLIESDATITSSSGLTALPYTNAEAPDPEARTMYRLAVVRNMYRPTVDRTMWRTP